MKNRAEMHQDKIAAITESLMSDCGCTGVEYAWDFDTEHHKFLIEFTGTKGWFMLRIGGVIMADSALEELVAAVKRPEIALRIKNSKSGSHWLLSGMDIEEYQENN